MTDDDVKTMLARRAEDVHASPDAWDAIATRLDKPQDSSRRLAALAGAAVAAALVAGVIVVAQNDSPTPPVTASTTTTVEPAGDPAQPKGAIVHVWPATDADGMVVLQEEASLGRRPDLLDPRAVAGAYLSDVLPSAAKFSVDEFQEGDSTSGEVPYSLDDEPAGTILVRRIADGTIWYVAGVTSPILEVTNVERATNGLRVHVRADFGSEAVVSVRNPGATSNTTASHAVSPETPDFTVELDGAKGNVWVQVVLHGEDGIIAIAVDLVS